MVAATVGATPGPNNKQKTVNVVGDVGVVGGGVVGVVVLVGVVILVGVGSGLNPS